MTQRSTAFEDEDRDWESDPDLDAEALEELFASPDVEEELELASGSLDGRRIELALRDLEDDAYRTGRELDSVDVQRAAARHGLSVAELAAVELRAEAIGLLPLSSDDSLPGRIAWEELERPEASGLDSLQRWFDEAARYPLLNQEQEVALARAIEASTAASRELVAASHRELDDRCGRSWKTSSSAECGRRRSSSSRTCGWSRASPSTIAAGRRLPRPAAGGRPRPGASGREVRVAARLQVLDLRDLVDPPVRSARGRQPGGPDPDPGAHPREDPRSSKRQRASSRSISPASPRSWSSRIASRHRSGRGRLPERPRDGRRVARPARR